MRGVIYNNSEGHASADPFRDIIMHGARRIVKGKARGNRRALVAETQASIAIEIGSKFPNTWRSHDLPVRISGNPVRCSCRRISGSRRRGRKKVLAVAERFFRDGSTTISELRGSETGRKRTREGKKTTPKRRESGAVLERVSAYPIG